MNSHVPTWQEQEAPRYTSYPPAFYFSPNINQEQHTNWLSKLQPNTKVSVYVHIPFCEKLCWFCGCHTKITQNKRKVSDYTKILLQEIALLRNITNKNGQLVNIHFGGGSPNILTSLDLEEILNGIKSLFSTHAIDELAIELDPRVTTPHQVETLAALGFNRISMGIQDFDPMVQEAINRVQPFSMVAALIDDLKKVNISAINCDLIYGLPHQNYANFKDTIDKVISLDPARIALFSYAHLPHIKKHQSMIKTTDLPSFAEKLAIYGMACKQLNEHGYTTIGIDHFAKQTDSMSIALQNYTLGRNFQGYTTASNSSGVLLGIGASAISQFREGYINNAVNVVEYKNAIQNNKLASNRGWEFTPEDLFRKEIVDTIMCYLAVDLNKICEKYCLTSSYFQDEISRLIEPAYQSIITVENNRIQITTKDRMAARLIAAAFDPRYTKNKQRCSLVN